MEKSNTTPAGRTIRGYRLEKLLASEMATQLYHGHTEELWLPPDIQLRIFPFFEQLAVHMRSRFLERFEREAQKTVLLRHPALLPLWGYGIQDEMPYLILPFSQSETLAEHLRLQARWEPTEAFALLTRLATVLDTLQQKGLVYQFLSPEHILLPRDQLPQLANLRLAQMVCVHDLDQEATHVADSLAHLRAPDGSYLGVAEYLAPEVVRGLPPDPRSDVYSLGVLLFVLLSGQHFASGTDYSTIVRNRLLDLPPALHELVPELPVSLDVVVQRALHPDVRARYPSAGAFAAACMSALSRVRRSHFSLLTSLKAQHQALPLLEQNQVWQAQLSQPAGPATQEEPLFADTYLLPSSHMEMVADAWLNTSEDAVDLGSAFTTAPAGTEAEGSAAASANINSTSDSSLSASRRVEPVSQVDWTAFQAQRSPLLTETGEHLFASAGRERATQPFSLLASEIQPAEPENLLPAVQHL